jgi:Mu transposase, C-terminal domain
VQFAPDAKGKIERPIPYIRSNFFLGRKFRDLADLNRQARQWLEQTANVRIHGTTHQRPTERFAQQEHAALRPLPGQAYRVVETLFRSSTRDGVICYGGNFYSVPAGYAARRGLRVEVGREELVIYQGREPIATHRLCPGKHHRIVDPNHLAGLTSATALTPMQQRLAELRALGPVAEQFVAGLVRVQTRFLGWQVNKLEETLWKFGPESLQEAMRRAQRYEAFDVRTLQNICHQQRSARPRPEAVAVGEIVSQVLAKFRGVEVAGRDLSDYDQAAETQELFPWTV